MPKEYSNKILKMQLTALYDEAHHRISLDMPDRRADEICPTCARNEERKKEAYDNMPEPWDDEAIPEPPAGLETCPIDAISEMLYHMLPAESRRIHTSNDDMPILNAYLVHIRHPWYKPDILDKQLDLVCKYRRENHLCAALPDACNECPITETHRLMAVVKNDTTSKPQNGWLNTKPVSYKWGVKCTKAGTTIKFDAHIRIPKGVSIYHGYDETEKWTKTFTRPDVITHFDDLTNNLAPNECVVLDCTGTNRQRFLLEIPNTGCPNLRLYANNILKTYFQNIQFYKVRRPPNQ